MSTLPFYTKNLEVSENWNSRQLMPPHGKLPPPVVVGREHEFVSAALRLRDMDSVLTRNGYPSELQLHRAMEDYYGLIEDYAAGVSLKSGSRIQAQRYICSGVTSRFR